MSKYHDRAVELRKDLDRHHNCAESIVLTFAPEAGINEETAMRFTSNFGKGMKNASTCGVITGGLMVLGLFNLTDQETINRYYQSFKRNHDGNTNCADLLRTNYVQGFDRKKHCDKLVFEGVALLEEILKEKQLID